MAITRKQPLADQTPLSISDAAAAIILVDGEGYLMQLRDSRPDIWYPGHWGFFGGAIDPGERPEEALARELREVDFDLPGLGLRKYRRDYYVVPVAGGAVSRLVLHEGAAMRVFSGADILAEAAVTPYDKFALFLHHARARLR
jgi:hypothetical protein